MTLVTIF